LYTETLQEKRKWVYCPIMTKKRTQVLSLLVERKKKKGGGGKEFHGPPAKRDICGVKKRRLFIPEKKRVKRGFRQRMRGEGGGVSSPGSPIFVGGEGYTSERGVPMGEIGRRKKKKGGKKEKSY